VESRGRAKDPTVCVFVCPGKRRTGRKGIEDSLDIFEGRNAKRGLACLGGGDADGRDDSLNMR